MILRDKNILFISPEPWSHIFVSKHHYATHLAARGNTVYFLNPPSGKLIEVSSTQYEHIYSINYNGFEKGLRFLPGWAQRKLINQKYRAIEHICNVKFDLVWSFDNSVFFDFNALPKHVLKISHIVDLNQDFQTKKAAKTASFCFGVIEEIVVRLKRFNKQSFLIPHGVQLFPSKIRKINLPGDNKIKALYTGNMSMPHIDWKTLYTIAQDNTSIDFIFLGPNYKTQLVTEKEKIKTLQNVFFLGAVTAENIPSFLFAANILLLAYDENYLKSYASPHKMLEYLQSGKAIITSKLPEHSILAKDSLIAMSDKNEYFPSLFQSVINNLDKWNSLDKTQKRVDYALEHTYDKQIEKIEKIIRHG